jgi:hypothetical protein
MFDQSGDFQLMIILFPREHMTCLETFLIAVIGYGVGVTVIYLVKARYTARHSTIYRTASPNKEFLTPPQHVKCLV